VISALLLSLLGVREEIIVVDYAPRARRSTRS
jgi:hypothetical protein